MSRFAYLLVWVEKTPLVKLIQSGVKFQRTF